jgi:site-specific recombinase XerD
VRLKNHLSKGGDKQHNIILSQKSCQWLKKFSSNFSQLMMHKERDCFFFTTQNRSDKPINRSSFDTELNNVLMKASEIYSKHIRTHSFMASITTDFLKSTPIDVVKEIVGHKDIGTTLQYKRTTIDPIQMKKVLQKFDLDRSPSELP